jgi:hypothetical protein
MLSCKARLFRGTPETVKGSGGIHQLDLDETNSLVINPKILSNLTPVEGKSWHVRNCMMKDLEYTIFTDWDPIFLATEMCKEIATDNIPKYAIIPSIKTPTFIENHDSHYLIPLLDTLSHIDQRWVNMTLCQVACAIEGSFREEFNDEHWLMEFLFNHYRKEFKKLCVIENTPLFRLHQCGFNITFDYDTFNTVIPQRINVTKEMKDVVMFPLSRIFNDKTYGNIPWLIGDSVTKSDVIKKAITIVHSSGFFKLTDYPDIEGVVFNNVCVFPEMEIDNRKYPAGSFIGIVRYEDGTTDSILCGEVFDETTTREQIIITFLFDAFISGHLYTELDTSKILRNLKLEGKQLPVRKVFIDKIQSVLLNRA